MSWTEPDTNTPHPSSFWEISELVVRFDPQTGGTGQRIIQYRGWHTKADHDAGESSIHEFNFRMPPGVIDYTQTIGGGLDLLDTFAASQPFFAGATPVARP